MAPHRIGAWIVMVAILTTGWMGVAWGAPLRLGTNVWPGYEPFYLAHALGALPAEEVRLVQFRSTTQVMNALRTEAIEAGAITLDEAISLAASGTDLTVVQVVDMSAGADAVLGGPGIKTMADLAGKRVGVENTAVGAYMLLRALELSDMKLDQVTLVPLEPGGQADAIKEGRADGVVCFEPVRGVLLRDGCTELFNSARIPGEVVDLVVVRTKVLAQHAPALARLRGAWSRGLERLAQHPEESLAIMGRRMGLNENETREALKGLNLLDCDASTALLAADGPLAETMTRMRDFLVREGLAAWGELPRLDAGPPCGTEGG